MDIIRRKIFPLVQQHLSQKEITLITGPRQAGKTTLMKQLEEDLKVRNLKTLFLDLDRDRDKPFFSSQDHLIQKMRSEIGDGGGYVFIDEIQRKEDAGVFLKGIYDMNLPYKIIASGSGSLELKEKIHESLAGRKRAFNLLTISFEEFVNFKHDSSIPSQTYPGFNELKDMAESFDYHKEISLLLLREYLSFGGYPRVVLENKPVEKEAIIEDIYKSYLEKDLAVLLNIQKTESLVQLVRILASQAGNLVNISELSGTLGLSAQTVKDYLWYLEKTFVIQKVTPFTTNIRKEITKAAIYYFIDLGLKNYSVNQFGSAGSSSLPPQGFLFQNFVFNYLKEVLIEKSSSTTIHFWRTQDKAEVDFVVNTGSEVIPVEVKYTNLKKLETTRSFKSFLSEYKPKKAFIVHLGKSYPPVGFEGTKIYLIPYDHCEVILKDLGGGVTEN